MPQLTILTNSFISWLFLNSVDNFYNGFSQKTWHLPEIVFLHGDIGDIVNIANIVSVFLWFYQKKRIHSVWMLLIYSERVSSWDRSGIEPYTYPTAPYIYYVYIPWFCFVHVKKIENDPFDPLALLRAQWPYKIAYISAHYHRKGQKGQKGHVFFFEIEADWQSAKLKEAKLEGWCWLVSGFWVGLKSRIHPTKLRWNPDLPPIKNAVFLTSCAEVASRQFENCAQGTYWLCKNCALALLAHLQIILRIYAL